MVEGNVHHTEQIKWLLQADTPSIRLFALTQIEGLPYDHPSVQAVTQRIAHEAPVKAILEAQKPQGYWEWEKSHYTPKYTASHWSMHLLTELGLSGSHPAMQAGAHYMQKSVMSGFYQRYGQDQNGFSCFWGNFLKYQFHCQQTNAETTQIILDLAVQEIEQDGTCPYNYDLPCAWGVIRALWGLAALPAELRSPKIQHAIQHGLEFILDRYSLVKADYPYQDKIHPIWFSLNFPLFYTTDILFTLRVLHDLNALDHPAAQNALQWLQDKRLKKGTWRGTSPYRSRTYAFTAGDDTVSHWVTAHALHVLNG